MCAFSSRGAMLRRQYNPTDVIRRLFSSKSRRNLSVASILNERTVGRRERFITWLKDIFNKSAEDKSYKADTAIVDRAATATTFNRPEIAAFMRPADSSDKADVVNQKLANFCVAQSTTKFEDENIHAEKRDTKNDGRAIRQSTISQPSCFTAGEPPFDHQIDTGSSWRDLGKMPRSEENGGAIEFAARDDIDVAVHYRCYTSPRHCYLLPPQRTKQPPLLGSRVPNRYISVPTRAIVGFAPRNSKSPIKEPNAPPEKHEKKDKRKKKKPVIRTEEDGEFVSVDSSENRAKMVEDDNPKGDPNVAFRYEWGVKLAEEQPAAEATGDNDNFAEKGQQYVTKRLWGVNLKQPEPDVQDAAPSTTASLEGGAGEPRNASSISENGDTTANGAKSGKQTAKKPNASSLKGTIAEYLSTPLSQTNDDLVAAQQDSGDANLYLSSEELRKIMRTSPNMLKEIIVVNDEYNVPEGVSPDAEIIAWRNLAMRSVPDVKDDFLSADNVENLEILSIRPEAPQPKLDVQVVKSAKDNLEDKKIKQSNSEYTSSKSTGIQQNKSLRKLDDAFTSKKLHTLSMQIRHMHRHINNIQRHTLSLSNNFTLVNKTQLKYPEFASALSTNSEDSLSKKMIDEASNQTESKSQNKEKSIDSNANNALSSDQFLLQPVEPQTFSNSSEEQVDLAKTLDVIADKEIESSINQMRSTDDKKITSLSDSTVSSEFTQDKSDYKDKNETRDYKKPDANYINLHNEATYTDFDAPSTDRNSNSKSNAIKSAKEDSKSKVDDDNSPNYVNDVEDDRSKEYIDGDYVRLPGDPYPYNRENLEKWRVPHSRNLVYKSFKRDTSRSSDSPTVARSTPRNANDAYANAVREPRDSHAGDPVMETSESGGGGASARNRTDRKSGFQVFSRNQRVVSDCLRDDVVDALGLRQWTEVFSRLDEKTSEAAQGGDVSFRTRYE